jgi:ribosomal-protein-alanine N-acetyltransferase
MTVRRGRPADHDRLREIQQAALAEPWPELLATAVEGPPPLYVVTDGGAVGYAIVVGDGTVAELSEIAIHPTRQREGHGSVLLTAVCDRLADDGYETVRLTVRAVDDGARSFYAGHGFEERNRLPDHYQDSDGLVLERPLSPGDG